MTTLDLLQTVADRQAITDIIYRYCRSMDRMDAELGYTLWHDDSIADYGSVYSGSGTGLIDHLCEQHKHTLYHSHQMSNIIIELDGNRAGSESCVTANLRIQHGEQVKQMTVWSRYIDTWSKRDGRWAIDKRIAIRDFDEIRDIAPLSQIESPGRRDHSDISYTVLGRQSS